MPELDRSREHGSRATLSASPNPIPWGPGLGSTTLSWDARDLTSAQLYARKDHENEALIGTGARGHVEVGWVVAGAKYEFRLYDGADRGNLLARVDVVRPLVPWELVADGLRQRAERGQRLDDIAELVGSILPWCLRSNRSRDYFFGWEKNGVHVTPVHFYQPIPDTRTLDESIWSKEYDTLGLDMREQDQLHLLTEIFPRFRDEYDEFPQKPTGRDHEYFFDNPQFGATDALVLYCMVRHFKPRRIIEVGSGFSSRVSALAATRNDSTELICVEPASDEPRHDALRAGFPGLASFINKAAQELPLEFYDTLGAGDILFIDTSHVSIVGGEVNFLFLEVLPRLVPGVIVHVHDVFIPYEYPRNWVYGLTRFYNEQYLLHAFLLHNREYEILFCNAFMGRRHRLAMRRTFSRSPWWGGGSLWMRRCEPHQ